MEILEKKKNEKKFFFCPKFQFYALDSSHHKNSKNDTMVKYLSNGV